MTSELAQLAKDVTHETYFVNIGRKFILYHKEIIIGAELVELFLYGNYYCIHADAVIKIWIFLYQKARWNIRNREKFSYTGLKLLLGSFARSINVRTSYRSKCTWNDCVKKYLFRVFILTQFYLYLPLRYIYVDYCR